MGVTSASSAREAVALTDLPVAGIFGEAIPARLDRKTQERVDVTLKLGVGLALVAPIVFLIPHLVNAFLLDHSVEWFDANGEGTPLAWASGMATAAVAIGAALAATMTGPVTPMMTLSAIAAFFSMDDVIGFHDKASGFVVRNLGLAPEWDSLLWPPVYLPLVLIAAVLVIRLGRRGTVASYRAILLGLGLLGAAIVLEIVSAPWSEGTNVVHTLEGGIEEAIELAGWVLIGTGVLCSVIANIAALGFEQREETAGTSL